MTSQARRGHRVFAALYDRVMAPVEYGVFARHRAALLSGLEGQVIDVGAGTGVNLPYYQRAARVVAAEPDPAMRRRLTARLGTMRVPAEVTGDPAESLSHASGTFDAVVCTLVLCTVADPGAALAEARRVLRPGGKLIILEHVRGDGALATWQDRLAPAWSRLAAGCQLNRDTAAAIEDAGFVTSQVYTFDPFPRWSPVRPILAAVASAPFIKSSG